MARVLLATPDDAVGERFRAVLGELPQYTLAPIATGSSDVLTQLGVEDAEILVVSEDIGPVPVLDLVRQVARAHPFTAVILLAGRSDPETMRQAMEAGIRGLLPATFTLADVESRLESAGAWAVTIRRHVAGEAAVSSGTGRIIAFCGAKGGVGTSTIALHVALQSAGSGLRTCLVDLDLQTGDIASFLDIRPSRDIVDLVDISSDITGRALDDVLYRHASGLRVLLAPSEGERGEQVTPPVARAILGALTSHFDVIIVDCGAVLAAGGAAAISLAEVAVTVLTPDTASVLGARRMHRLWDRLSLRGEDDAVVLVNRASRGSEVQPELVQRMLKLAKPPLEVPADFRALEAALNTGDPARLLDRDVRRALATVASDLGARREMAPAPEGRRGRRAAPAGSLLSRRRDTGQVAVETVGLFFLLATICLALLQGALIGASYVLGAHAASAAARVAVSPDKSYGQIRQAAVHELPGQWGSHVDVTVGGQHDADARSRDRNAAVVVSLRTPSVVPFVGRMFSSALAVESQAQMHYEGRR